MSWVEWVGRKARCCSARIPPRSQYFPKHMAMSLSITPPECCHEVDALAVATLRRVLLLKQHLNGGVLLMLLHHSCLPHGHDDVVESMKWGLGLRLMIPAGSSPDPTIFLLDIFGITSSTSKEDDISLSGTQLVQCLTCSDILGLGLVSYC